MGVGEPYAQLPLELQRAVPRPVRLTTAGKIVLAAALLSVPEALVFGAWLYDVARRNLTEAEQRRRAAIATEALVIDLRRSGKSGWRVDYEFEAADGRKHGGSFRVRHGRQGSYRPGSKLKVFYLSETPDVNWPAHMGQGLPVWLGPAVAASLLSVSAGLLLWLRSQRRLLEEGRAAIGVVTRVDRIRGKSMRYRVHYEFRLPSGAIQSGRYEIRRDPPSAGAAAILIYDPENPRRRRPYPFALVRVATE